MTHTPNIVSPIPDARYEHLHNNLIRALELMDELRPSSVPAARLQQILDELETEFGSSDGNNS